MHEAPAWRTLGLLLAFWLALTPVRPTVGQAGPPADRDVAAGPTVPESAYRQALELERSRKWSAAIDLYERTLDRWPDRPEYSGLRADFVHRLRLCETHYRLGRRYQDKSFRETLLRLPPDRALDLYDELIERIESQYVEPVALDPLVRRGLDNLEVALRDPAFLSTNAPGAPADRVVKLRESLRALRERTVAPDRRAARAVVASACEKARQALDLSAAPIALEFAFGACDALDDYSSYLTPDKLDDLYAMIDGNFVGLGVELKHDEAGLMLVGVIPGGPAWEAGLRTGDRIVRIDGKAIAGLGLDESAGRLQGPEGTTIDLGFVRGETPELALRLTRRPVEVRSVGQSRIVDPANGIGYLQLTGFQKSSLDEVGRAIAGLQRQGMRSLILDLRGNPGGLLNVAVELAEKFLDSGVIVSTRGRAAGQSFVYRAKAPASWTMPLTVLVDRDSASASEILAGALQDHQRAVVVGEKSYGKGSVQSIFSLRTAPAGLKLTTAKFYSPRNRPYAEQGVEPDVTVRQAARPASDRSEGPSPDLGDPEHDLVLARAIQQARQPLVNRR